jgi:hypothetical protein
MKKISTLFKKDPQDLGLVTNEVSPENSWVMDGDFIATRKFDGMACAIIKGELYKRIDIKKKKQAPKDAIPCQEPDTKSGHHPHWVKCVREDNKDNLFFEAFDLLLTKDEGTYELCGERISTERFIQNFNVEKIEGHKLIRHGSEILDITDVTYEGLKDYLSNPENDIEGIVFYHKEDDRMCKLRKKDFGFKR